MTDGPATGTVQSESAGVDASNHPHIVCAADDNYAKCLAAMSASLIFNAAADTRITLYVLDGGISEESRRLLELGWKNKPIDIHWITPDAKSLDGLETSQHINRMTYFRILIGSVLPVSLSRVIYLDVDMVLEHDINELWREGFDGAVCLAVQDSGAPFIDSRESLPNFPQCQRFLASECPVPNYTDLGLDGASPYLNGGVLSIDLEAWRKSNIQEQMLHCLAKNAASILFWDQYALNVVLHNKWRPLDPRWNQTPGIFTYPKWDSSPFDERTFHVAQSNPYIRHFASAIKPWQFGFRGRGRERFYSYLDMTAWKGWRPPLNLREIKRNAVFQWKYQKSRAVQSLINLFSVHKN